MVQRGKKITIHEIAERANVSISTVSRVMNSAKGVSDEKRHAVLSAIEELDYRPNQSAQGLASGQSMTIGVVTQFINSPHFSAMTSGIMQGFNDGEYSVVFTDGSFDPEKEKGIITDLLNRHIDGLILLVGGMGDDAVMQLSQQIPLIVVGRNVTEISNQCVYIDQYAAAYHAMRHLINMGHRNIAHIVGEATHRDAIDRKLAYKAALEDAGITPDPGLIVQGDFLEQSGLMAVEMLFTRGKPFTAIFAANDQMASGARLALFRKGIRVPEDVSIIGFDDQSFANYMTPPLTTVRQPSLEMGRTAARMMLKLLNDEPLDPPNFHGELIIRESVAKLW